MVVLFSEGPATGVGRLFALSDRTEDGLRVVRLRHRPVRLRRAGSALTVLGLSAALGRLRREGFAPDVLHAHTLEAAVAAAVLGRLHGIPVVVSEHWSGFPLGTLTPWQRVLARRVFQDADAVCPVSESLRRAIEPYAPRARMRVVGNVVDTSLFAPPDARPSHDGPPRLLAVALLSDKKGLGVLLEALARRAAGGRPPVSLDIVGDGPERAALHARARDLDLDGAVRFLGVASRETVARHMAESDLFVLSSRVETFGMALVEALALGTVGGLVGLGFYALTSGSVLQGLSPTMAIVTFASLPFALAWLFMAAVALALERYEAYGAITIVQPAAQVVLAVTLAATVGTLGAVLGFAISQVVGTAAAAVLVRDRDRGAAPPRRAGELRAAARFGLLSWGSEVLQNLNYRLDLFVLNAFGVTADVGVYSVALTVTSFAWILPSALQTVLFPRTARLDTGDPPASAEPGGLTDVELAASRGTRQAVLLLIPTAVALVFTLLVLVPLLYGARFDRTTDLGLILVPGTLALGFARVLVAVTSGRGRPQYSLYGRLIDMPITAVLYFVLIPAHGATGAAIASSISYALTGVISFVFFRRVVDLPLRTLLVPTRADLEDWRSAGRAVRRRLRGAAEAP